MKMAMKASSCILVACVLLLAASAPHVLAQEPAKPLQFIDHGYRGEWRRTGDGFACTVPMNKRGELVGDEIVQKLALACYFMGPLSIGGEVSQLKRFGIPVRTLAQPRGAIAYIFLLNPPSEKAYLVATVLEKRIVSLQVSGRGSAQGFTFTFNYIDVGTSVAIVEQHFGRPFKVEPSGLKDTDLWSYLPWRFSFEVSAGRVTSIRIVHPEY